MSDLTASDVFAMTNGRGNDFLNGNGILIILFFLIFGYGGFGNWNGNAAAQGALTRAELTEGLNNQSLQREVTDLNASINGGFAGVQQSLCSGFGNLANVMNQNTNSINASIACLGSQMQQNCCDLKTAMHAEGEMTRSLIQHNTEQNLRDRLADKDRELQSTGIAAAILNQTNNLENWFRQYTNGCC